MVLLDTNVFVIDRFFVRDPRYGPNRQFLDKLTEIDAGFAFFSLLELCGIASFNLSPAELRRWLFGFDRVYPVRIVQPSGLANSITSDMWFGDFSAAIVERLTRKATLGDALIVLAAEQANATAIISWNPRHFADRTSIPVYTSEEFLEQIG